MQIYDYHLLISLFFLNLGAVCSVLHPPQINCLILFIHFCSFLCCLLFTRRGSLFSIRNSCTSFALWNVWLKKKTKRKKNSFRKSYFFLLRSTELIVVLMALTERWRYDRTLNERCGANRCFCSLCICLLENWLGWWDDDDAARVSWPSSCCGCYT